ncbi:TIM barrel protein [Halomonas huangheensis]|uniref:Hydroxypyruvate isomerase n=1 Tax=Halomonas huangheensis TaxID=1178482 RepID=W1N4L4_9GAMM|nr:TIM barrel protein [Halomonas huangheensis]ALM51933.1 hydroxypyruvate isomerase [Halomonas huangheensis]ERL50468.1 hydroxypyruvate isomerase [Halomonas huangheensis]
MSENSRTSPFTLAVCAEMVFLDLPMDERVRRIDGLGFLVEIWSWGRHDIQALANTGATFSSMTGYIEGSLADRDGAERLVQTARESITIARRLNIPRLNLHGTGLDERGMPFKPVSQLTGTMWIRAHDTLNRLADLAQEHDVTFVVENLNTQVDHPGVPFARADEVLELVASVNRPQIRMMLDLYHAQIGEGNLIDLVHRCAPWIGEVQVADVPGRCEPGSGEIHYPAIARALDDIGYRGTVGMEGWASGEVEPALQRFKDAFTL